MKYFILTLFLVGCADLSQTPIENLPTAENDGCNAAQYATFLKGSVTALETTFIKQPVRIVRPGQMVTMDFLPHRLNFHLDDSEIVQRISCG